MMTAPKAAENDAAENDAAGDVTAGGMAAGDMTAADNEHPGNMNRIRATKRRTQGQRIF